MEDGLPHRIIAPEHGSGDTQETQLVVLDKDTPNKSRILYPDLTASLTQCNMALEYYNNTCPEESGDAVIPGYKVFFREGRLIRLEIVNGELTTLPVTKDWLPTALLRSEWRKPARDGTSIPAHTLPRDLINACYGADRATLPSVPEFKGFYDGAMLTPHGELITKKGFDRTTGLYFREDYGNISVPENPDTEDVAAALDVLREPLKEFAYAGRGGVDSVNYQNTIFVLVTAVLYPQWDIGALPVWVVDKSTTGAGASLLQSTVCRMAYGHAPNPAVAPTFAAEFDKLYNSLAKDGRDFTLIDNITDACRWVSPNLLSMTSGSGESSHREFGRTEMQTCKGHTLIAVNGKHVKINEDICRRVIVTRLEPQKAWQEMEGSFSRTRDELDKFAIEQHPGVVRAVAILLRSWRLAGEPKPPQPRGNFSEYPELYRVVGGMLYHAGYRNFLTDLPDVQTSEDETQDTDVRFLEEFAARFPDGGMPLDVCGALLTEAGERAGGSGPGGFLEYVTDDILERAMRKTLRAETVGRWLGSKCNMKYPGYPKMLVREHTRRGTIYQVVPIESQSVLV